MCCLETVLNFSVDKLITCSQSLPCFKIGLTSFLHLNNLEPSKFQFTIKSLF